MRKAKSSAAPLHNFCGLVHISDVCFPTTPEMRKVLHTAVLGEYQKVMEQLASRGEQTRASVLDALKNVAKTAAERPAPAPDRAPQQHKADKGAR